MNETDVAMAVACGWITTADDGQRTGAMSLAVLAMPEYSAAWPSGFVTWLTLQWTS